MIGQYLHFKPFLRNFNVALLLPLLCLSLGEALKCYTCMGSTDEDCNRQGSKTCPSYSDACAVVRGHGSKFNGYIVNSSYSCMAAMDERKLSENIFFISLDVGDKAQRDKSLGKALMTVCVCVLRGGTGSGWCLRKTDCSV